MGFAVMRGAGATEYSQSPIYVGKPDKAESVRSQCRLLRHLHGVGGSRAHHEREGAPQRGKEASGRIGSSIADRTLSTVCNSFSQADRSKGPALPPPAPPKSPAQLIATPFPR